MYAVCGIYVYAYIYALCIHTTYSVYIYNAAILKCGKGPAWALPSYISENKREASEKYTLLIILDQGFN